MDDGLIVLKLHVYIISEILATLLRNIKQSSNIFKFKN